MACQKIDEFYDDPITSGSTGPKDPYRSRVYMDMFLEKKENLRAGPQAGAAAAAGAWRLFTIVELPRPKIENKVDDAIHTWEARNRPSRRRRTKHS